MLDIMVAPKERREELWDLFLEYVECLREYDGEVRPHRKRHYPYFDSYWEDEGRTAFIILYDHEPVGFCLLHDTGVSYRIDEFYIRPLHTRRRFGSQAVEFIRDHCREMGRHDVLAANVYVNNTPAIGFWKAVGFRDTGRRIRAKGVRLMEMENSLKDGEKPRE